METKKLYTCAQCGEEVELERKEEHERECSRKSLRSVEDLEPCLKTDTAEHARGGDEDDACYDGREGKI